MVIIKIYFLLEYVICTEFDFKKTKTDQIFDANLKKCINFSYGNKENFFVQNINWSRKLYIINESYRNPLNLIISKLAKEIEIKKMFPNYIYSNKFLIDNKTGKTSEFTHYTYHEITSLYDTFAKQDLYWDCVLGYVCAFYNSKWEESISNKISSVSDYKAFICYIVKEMQFKPKFYKSIISLLVALNVIEIK